MTEHLQEHLRGWISGARQQTVSSDVYIVHAQSALSDDQASGSMHLVLPRLLLWVSRVRRQTVSSEAFGRYLMHCALARWVETFT